MLRSDLNIIIDAHRGVCGGLVRGKCYIDSVDLGLYKADGQLVATAFGIPVYRESDLNNGKYQYCDSAGNVLASN